MVKKWRIIAITRSIASKIAIFGHFWPFSGVFQGKHILTLNLFFTETVDACPDVIQSIWYAYNLLIYYIRHDIVGQSSVTSPVTSELNNFGGLYRKTEPSTQFFHLKILEYLNEPCSNGYVNFRGNQRNIFLAKKWMHPLIWPFNGTSRAKWSLSP